MKAVPFALVVALSLWSLPARPAQDAAQGSPRDAAAQPPAPKPGDAGDALSGRRQELRGMEDTLQTSQAQRAKIEAEVAAIRTDRAKLEAALVDLAKTIDDREGKIAAAEARLDELTGSEEAIRHSLDSRRAVIAEILAALQRMGRKPPPALLVAPEDMLAAIRTSMMLGSVLPEMRADTEALASDLSDLLALRRSIAAERDLLAGDVAKLGLDRQRLAALIDARRVGAGRGRTGAWRRARPRHRSRSAGGESEGSDHPDGDGTAAAGRPCASSALRAASAAQAAGNSVSIRVIGMAGEFAACERDRWRGRAERQAPVRPRPAGLAGVDQGRETLTVGPSLATSAAGNRARRRSSGARREDRRDQRRSAFGVRAHFRQHRTQHHRRANGGQHVFRRDQESWRRLTAHPLQGGQDLGDRPRRLSRECRITSSLASHSMEPRRQIGEYCPHDRQI